MEHTLYILLLPFLSFLVLGLLDSKISKKTAGIIGTLSLGVVTLLSYWTAFAYFSAERVNGVYETLMPYNITWLPLGNLHFDMGIMLDPISVMMLIVISTVSLMVHIYSFGYMHGERGFQRYYAFLSLFTMSMLGLVVATNIFQMYLFWELVGVSSYLLIGFYYTTPAAIAASKKAFIVTRFADMFFLVGILIYGYYCQSFGFDFNAEGSVGIYDGVGYEVLDNGYIRVFVDMDAVTQFTGIPTSKVINTIYIRGSYTTASGTITNICINEAAKPLSHGERFYANTDSNLMFSGNTAGAETVSFEYKITNEGTFHLAALNSDWSKYYGYYAFNDQGADADYAGITCEKLSDGYIRVTLTLSELMRTNNNDNRDSVPENLSLLYIAGRFSNANGYIDNIQIN